MQGGSVDVTATRQGVADLLYDLNVGDSAICLNTVVRNGRPTIDWLAGTGHWNGQRSALSTPQFQARAWDLLDHRRAAAAHFGAFRDVCTVFPREVLVQSPLWQGGFSDVEHIARVLIRDNGMVVGWVAVLRKCKTPGYRPADLRRLNAVLPEVCRRLRLAARASVVRNSPTDLLFTANGDLMYAPNTLDMSKISGFHLAGIRHVIGSMKSEGLDSIETVAFTVTRMQGSYDAAFLVHLHGLHPAVWKPDVLTPREREAAEYFSHGATALEVARCLDLSVHTVKQHLKSVYRKLDVASRLELADSLRQFEDEET